jgi:hypothetical protein
MLTQLIIDIKSFLEKLLCQRKRTLTLFRVIFTSVLFHNCSTYSTGNFTRELSTLSIGEVYVKVTQDSVAGLYGPLVIIRFCCRSR